MHCSHCRLLRSRRVIRLRQHIWSFRCQEIVLCFSHLWLSGLYSFEVESFWLVILIIVEHLPWLGIWGGDAAASHPHLRNPGHLLCYDHFLGLINCLFFILHEILLVLDNSVDCFFSVWLLFSFKHFFLQLGDGCLQRLSDRLPMRTLGAFCAVVSLRTLRSWWFSSWYTFRAFRFRLWTLRHDALNFGALVLHRFRVLLHVIVASRGENII